VAANTTIWTPSSLTGKARDHIHQNESPRFAIHRDALAGYEAMRSAASQHGFDIEINSGFRDFDTQLSIWNRKFRGERPLYGRDGSVMNRSAMTEEQVVDAILIWSALPGASRHHWGTEIDVVDRAATPDGYEIQLLPAEYEAGAIYGPFNAWLNDNIELFGFFRPYREFRGGVSHEPWHLSYAPVSGPAMQAHTIDVLADAIESAEIEGSAVILDKLDWIYQNYVLNICEPVKW
jgi:LAS superfamily LD-carboxypeptidase LdcB